MRHSTLSKTCAALAVAAAFQFAAPAAFAQESTDPIKLTLHDWTGQLITTNIMGEVLKKAGYNIEYVQADYLAQFAGLETGDLTLAMEMWETTGREAMDASTATGKTENIGPTGMKAKEEWWYPEYMKEKCPGLPNWEALKDPACAEAFSTAETAPKGRYLGGPVTWGGFDDERVEVRNWKAPISARRRSCCGSMRRTGLRPSTRASGSNSRNIPRSAIPTLHGAAIRMRSTTAASLSARSGRSPGRA